MTPYGNPMQARSIVSSVVASRQDEVFGAAIDGPVQLDDPDRRVG